MKKIAAYAAWTVAVVVVTGAASGCAPTMTTTTTLTPGGQVADRTVAKNDQVLSELHRVFDTTVITGEGVIENSNEGLARQAALSLAQADLAQKVQVSVRGNTVIYNAQDVRSVVETNVNALVSGYSVDFAGYDPNSARYRVRISVHGEQLVKEVERVRTR